MIKGVVGASEGRFLNGKTEGVDILQDTEEKVDILS